MAMHHDDLSRWQHSHRFGTHAARAERGTQWVVAITATMMLVEIAAGTAFGSMALLADGWHMSTHVAAFLIAALAYAYSRRRADDPRYSFGTGKVGVLGGFASAILLAMVALLMAVESLQRLWSPTAIRFDEAIAVAAVGLVVNLGCAWLLKDGHHHHHHHDHHDKHARGGHRDINLRSAYIHVLADALTSVTAIVALAGGKAFGWYWLDPVMGLVGSAVVSAWAWGLLRDSSGILLDRTPADSDLCGEIRSAIESDGDAKITDLHVWQLGAGQFSAIVSIAAHAPLDADVYRARVAMHEELVHVTVEVRRVCGDADAQKLAA